MSRIKLKTFYGYKGCKIRYKSNRKTTYLLGSPLESSDTGILDLIEVLDSLCAVDHYVGSTGLGTKAPDLSGLSDIELVLVGEVTATDLEVVPGVDLTLVNVLSQTIGHGNGPHEKPVEDENIRFEHLENYQN